MRRSAGARSAQEHNGGSRFHHEALFYAGPGEFLDQTASFIRQGVAAGEPVLVAVPGPKLDSLRTRLGSTADQVQFADMVELGHNPARIIPAWRRFADEHSGRTRPLRGIGEPIWAGRSAAELVEAQGHESLLNLALEDVSGLRLLCPYDMGVLDPAVIEEAQRSHPVVVRDGVRLASTSCRDTDSMGRAPFTAPLPEPDLSTDLVFEAASLGELRDFVREQAWLAQRDPNLAYRSVLAVNEVATNTLRHGGGIGVLRAWQVEGSLIFEVRDKGRLDTPLAGRKYPRSDEVGGRGLWMVNQLSDLAQVRTDSSGTIVRLHFRYRNI